MTLRLEEQIRRYALAVDEMAPDVEALLPAELTEEFGVDAPAVEVTIPLRPEKSRSRIPGWVMGVAAAAAVLILALPLWLSLLIQQEDVVATTQPAPITTVPSVGVPGLVRNPDNGHFYQAVVNESDSITWDEARARAAGLSLQGFPGHLATITSEQEGLFVRDAFSEFLDSGPWIGGFQPEGAAEPDSGWRWVTSEPFDYTNWGEGEPNNDGGDENCIQIFDESPPIWNDFPCAAGSGVVFLVEYDVPPGETTNYNVDISASFEATRSGEPVLVSVEGHGNSANDWPSTLDLVIEVRSTDGSYQCSYSNLQHPFTDAGGTLRIDFSGTSDCGVDWQGSLVVDHDGSLVDTTTNEGLRVDDEGVQDPDAVVRLQITETGANGDEQSVDVAGAAFYQAILERFFNSG